MIAYLRLLRAGLLLSPAADVMAGMCLAAAPWSPEAARAMAASACVYAAGMVLNDYADRAEDAVRRPERPIPSGAVAASTALVLGLVLLAAGTALSPMPAYHGALAALVLAYDFALKRYPASAALTMGVLRGANLAAGAVVVTAAPPDRTVMIAAACYALYIVAVTVLGILEDEARPPQRAVRSIVQAPPVLAFGALLAMPQPLPAAAIAAALALPFLVAAGRRRSWDQPAIRRAMTWLLLGTMLYTSLLCLASGRAREALAAFLAALLGRRLTRWIAAT